MHDMREEQGARQRRVDRVQLAHGVEPRQAPGRRYRHHGGALLLPGLHREDPREEGCEKGSGGSSESSGWRQRQRAASKRQKKQPASSESPTSTAQPAAKTPTTTHAATEAAGGAVGFGFDAAINALMADGITSSKRDMNRIQAAIIAKEQAAAPAPAPKAAVSAAERRAAQQRRLAKQLASTECAGAHFGFAAHFSPGQQPVESDQPWSRFTPE